MTLAIGGVVLYLALGVIGFLVRPQWICGVLAILAGSVSLALWAPGFPEEALGGGGWGIPVAGDPWALGMWALALVVHGAVLLHERARPGAFHPVLTLLVGSCLAAVVSGDLFNLYVTLELVSLLSFILVGYEGQPRAVWAGLQYLILATVGMTLYLLGVGLVYGKLGTLSLSAIAALGRGLSDPAVAIGAGLLVAGAAIKGGVFLFGLWLPPAHGYAPTGVSVVLSAVVVKTGVVALARLAAAFPVGPILVAIGILTGFGGLVYALWERDLKVFLAFSTVSQLGYILIGLGLGGQALLGAILYAVAHGLFKGLLFLAAGQAIEETGEREIASLAGRLSWPTALGLAVGTWAIAGLPPLAGFAAKGALTADLSPMARAVLGALSVGTAALCARLIPLLRPGPKGTASPGGVTVLIVSLVGFGLWGFLRLPGLLAPGKWAEAVGEALGGYGLYLLLRRVRPPLPRITLDRATVLALLGATALVAGILLLG